MFWLRASCILSICILLPTIGYAQQTQDIGTIDVTSTTRSQSVPDEPLPVQTITAEELNARGISDLAGVLELVAGATPVRGGDSGPAGTIPGLLGSREADDYLLVVDGVPIGATTSPSFEAVDLANVKLIEVRRGPDPVIYGSAAFAGTIEIIHYPAGESSQRADAYAGSYGSKGMDISTTLPAMGGISQSVSATASRLGFSDARSDADRYQALYRASSDLGIGQVGLDIGFLDLKQVPSSPTPVAQYGLATDVPIDSNQNPAGAEIDEYRSTLTLNYDQPLAGGDWSSTASLAHTSTAIVQGFLTDDYDAPATDPNAEGYSQDRHLTEAYLDSHLTWESGTDLRFILGVNDMYSNGYADSASFSYYAPFATGAMPTSASQTPDGSSDAQDNRNFIGVYIQTHWQFAEDFNLDVGLRQNMTQEDRDADDQDDSSDQTDEDALPDQTQANSRLSSSAQLSWQAIRDPGYTLTPYIAYADTFQPSQFDFSPDPDDAALLQPETARSWQPGVRGTNAAFDWEISLINVDFNNSVITQDVHGIPVLVNGGSDRYRSIDADVDFHISEHARLILDYGYNDARYRNYIVDSDDGNIQLSGKRLTLTPISTASVRFNYGWTQGISAAISANYVGNRYLDQFNTVDARAFISYSGKIADTVGAWNIYLTGTNLTNRRDPVAASEIGEGQMYRVAGRVIELGLEHSL